MFELTTLSNNFCSLKICKIGNNKYATNFIVFSMEDRKYTEGVSEPLVKTISDRFENLLHSKEAMVSQLDFYGHDFGMERLGFLLIPYILRRKIGLLKNTRLQLDNGPFPIRKDGGYGWFIVEETVDETESCAEYNSGCNVAGDDSGGKNEILSHIYYYWISKYFDNDVYQNRGTRWLCANNILQSSKNGMIDKNELSEEDAAKLIQNNLIDKPGFVIGITESEHIRLKDRIRVLTEADMLPLRGSEPGIIAFHMFSPFV